MNILVFLLNDIDLLQSAAQTTTSQTKDDVHGENTCYWFTFPTKYCVIPPGTTGGSSEHSAAALVDPHCVAVMEVMVISATFICHVLSFLPHSEQP